MLAQTLGMLGESVVTADTQSGFEVITSISTPDSMMNLAWLESQGYSRDDVIAIILDTSHDDHGDITSFLTNRRHPGQVAISNDLTNALADPVNFEYIQTNFDHSELTPNTDIMYLPMDVLEWLLQEISWGQ